VLFVEEQRDVYETSRGVVSDSWLSCVSIANKDTPHLFSSLRQSVVWVRGQLDFTVVRTSCHCVEFLTLHEDRHTYMTRIHTGRTYGLLVRNGELLCFLALTRCDWLQHYKSTTNPQQIRLVEFGF